MDESELRLLMLSDYSSAIDFFSERDFKNAYESMRKAGQDALELSKSVENMDDSKEYRELSDHYFDKAEGYKSFLDKKDDFLMDEPTRGFDDFLGLDDIKSYLKDSIITPWKNNNFSSRIKNGLLIYGPHGIGKTRFAHALFKELGARCVYFQPIRHFRAENFVDVEYEYNSLFRQAEKENNVVFFIESPIPFFSDGTDELSQDTTELFLRLFKNELKRIRKKKLNILLVATTSVPDKLSRKVFSEGVFDDIIRIHRPDKELRRKLFERYLGGYDVSSEVLDELVLLSHGFVTKDISRLSQNIISRKAFPKEEMEKVYKDFVPEDISAYEKSVRIFEENL